MLQLWILAVLGMILSFGIKYQARRNTDTKPSLSYWIRDNWFEFTLTFIVLVILMKVMTNPDTGYDQEAFNAFVNEKIPALSWVTLPVKIVIPVLIGYGANEVIYLLVKRKVKTAEKK